MQTTKPYTQPTESTSSVDRADEAKRKTGDDPLGRKVPGAPFAVVALTYIAILGVVTLAITLGIWFL